jgi:ornithine cyclodeaminase
MGADTKGKQELDPHLVAAASIFYDEATQALSICECQHAFALGLISKSSLKASIGAVINGVASGRVSDKEITLFDGTGVSLQDLVVADLVVRRARETGKGQIVTY